MAVTEGKAWTITQLGGARRVLQLAGWAAPFGGPRVGAVVRTPVEIRTERVYYPGSKTPTRHLFGEKFADWELRGRFRDRARPPFGGTGFAKAKTEEVIAFVRDQQVVRIAWGDILFAERAFIVEFDPGWEAEREVEWVMRIEVDEQKPSPASRIAERSFATPADQTREIRSALAEAQRKISLLELPGALLNVLDEIFSVATGAAGQLDLALAAIQSLRDAPFAALSKAQETQATVSRTVAQLRETLATIPQDALVFRDSADATIKLLTTQADLELEFAQMVAELAEMDRAVLVAKAGRARTSYAARTGDTWESISSQFFGRPDRAGDIRDLNAISAGQNPVAGVEYLIPA